MPKKWDMTDNIFKRFFDWILRRNKKGKSKRSRIRW